MTQPVPSVTSVATSVPGFRAHREQHAMQGDVRASRTQRDHPGHLHVRRIRRRRTRLVPGQLLSEARAQPQTSTDICGSTDTGADWRFRGVTTL